MRPQRKFAAALAGAYLVVLGVAIASCTIVLVVAEPLHRAAGLVAVAVLLLGGLWGLSQSVFRHYVSAPSGMAEEVRIIAEANPAHRIRTAGAPELAELARSVNRLAERFQSARSDVEAQVNAALVGAEEEKLRLIALMSQLAQGVLVCDVEGRILLYNSGAKELLAPPSRMQSGSAGLIGLGRSLYPAIEHNLIAHALDIVRQRVREGSPNPVAIFMTTTKAGQLVRAQMVPVSGIGRREAGAAAPGGETDITGFVLTLEDITRSVESASRVDALMQSVTEGSRASLGNIRAAVETMLAVPEMEKGQQQKFMQVINDEAGALSERLEQTVAGYTDSLKAQWSIEEILAADLVSAARRRIEGKLGIRTMSAARANGEPLWVKADSYSLVQSISYLASRLKYECDIQEIGFRLARAGRFAQFDLAWAGDPIAMDTLRAWESQPLRIGGEASPLSVREVMERHGGEFWYRYDNALRQAQYRLLIPVAYHEDPAGSEQERLGHYDLDLFRRPGAANALDQRPLAELTYTVVSTATAGPKSSEGDAVIFLGAVRIVNGRMLHTEVFEQLVDPLRQVPADAAKSRGIDLSMLAGRPTAEKALPALHRFCQDTVLVPHDAARVIGFLKSKEVRTGIKFTQPVLDVSLLSAAVNPGLTEHGLRAIADRLGVRVKEDQTLLGDALVVGEVFLRLIPLLAERGVVTLEQATEASRRTYDSRRNLL